MLAPVTVSWTDYQVLQGYSMTHDGDFDGAQFVANGSSFVEITWV
jgi:hypothetical protein